MDENTEKEKLNIGYILLGLFFPPIGIILYFVFKDDKPLAAKSCRKGFVIGFIIYAVVIAICAITCTASVGALMFS